MSDRIAELRRGVVGHFDDEAPSAVETSVSLRAIDLGDLLARPEEPIPWAVPGWLAKGGTAILGGEPKLGKTTVAHDLAFAMATGGLWLGHVAVKGGPYRILYLDEENSARLVRRRLRQLAEAYNLRDVDLVQMAARLKYLNRNSLNLDRDVTRSRSKPTRLGEASSRAKTDSLADDRMPAPKMRSPLLPRIRPNSTVYQ